MALDGNALTEIADDAEHLAARLEELGLVAMDIAKSVNAGLHGRRRSGLGDDFWQYRRFNTGDDAHSIDWRRSARHERDVLFVREKELQTAQTVWVWTDFTPSMGYKSAIADTLKVERALTLMFAITHALIKNGERVGVPDLMAPTMRRGALRLMVDNIVGSFAQTEPTRFPPPDDIRAASSVVIFSDFLDMPEEIDADLAILASRYADIHLVEIADPSEEDFPFAGRTRFLPVDGGQTYTAGRAETIRARYQDALAAHREAVLHAANRHGATYLRHRTDHAPDLALMALAGALSGAPILAVAS